MQPIQHMLGNAGLFLEMAEYKGLEETRRTGSDLADRKFSDFELFRGFPDDTGLREAYQNMQRNYVFSEKDVKVFHVHNKTLRQIFYPQISFPGGLFLPETALGTVEKLSLKV